MNIIIDDLSTNAVAKLLQEHLDDMYATSPAESVHALDINKLKAPEITFFSAWQEQCLLGCVAIKQLSDHHGEIKSMRTTSKARNKAVATKLLEHVIAIAKQRNYRRLSLETGVQDFFLPARKLYEKFNFEYCEPFSDYTQATSRCLFSWN
ncbi:GNAT family N-acetyltransferase [Endozoicomonas sp. G2_1]|uniref:GNAT family N-acetyltransferase n=1 Tax=Endozoicomonas sp. G2_1 TaxID=2821091 RepID=UPI001ADD38E6|nr:GNAT family N-acetyltransferase [Endozoicomonas sp. G2_1]MBO9490649.1 GNAT family N-acetyltransferase [Endozoicomonas sp. G2_1]